VGIVTAAVLAGAAGWYVTRPRECPAVGCTSSVRFDLLLLDPAVRDVAATAKVCFDGTCTFEVITDNQPSLVVQHEGRTVRSGSITIEDRLGAVVKHLELTHEVEGTETRTFDGCIPACWSVVLVDRDGELDAR
jgi:hypothetical protein